MTLETVSFEGHDVRAPRDDGAVTVMVTTSVGPRVLGLTGEVTEPLRGPARRGARTAPAAVGSRFVGGHRLWAAPEVPEVTYQPDERPCAVIEVDGGVRVEAPPDGAGLVKALQVRRTDGRLDRRPRDRQRLGPPVTVAPWAITQLRARRNGDPAAAAARRRDPRPTARSCSGPTRTSATLGSCVESSAVRVRSAGRAVPRSSWGSAPGDGTLAYRMGDEVFEKRVDVDPAAAYADRGAALQVYLCEDFCELETLGPLRDARAWRGA